jgi:hypothetical protein
LNDVKPASRDLSLKEKVNDVISSNLDPMSYLKELDYPRRAGTSGDKKAADYLVSTLKEYGYDPVIQEFHYWKENKLASLRLPLVLLIWGLITLLNLQYLDNNKLIGFLTLLLPLLIVIVLLRFEWVMKYFFRRRQRKMEELKAKIDNMELTSEEKKNLISSQNIIAEIGDQDASNHILFTAHFDSISSRFSMKFTKIAGIIGSVSFILFYLLYTINFIGELYFEWNFIAILGPVYFLLVIFMLIPIEFIILARIFRGNKSHGIIDDGTGVAILLAIAKFLKSQNIKGNKFTFGFFSAEEAGLIGSSYYNRHSNQERNMHIISVDMIGEKPPLAYVKGVNPLIKTKLSPEFNEQIASIAGQLDIEVKGSNFMYPGSDFAHWLFSGYKTNWLINGSKFIHSKHDTLENLDKSLVMDALKLLIAYLVLEFQMTTDLKV